MDDHHSFEHQFFMKIAQSFPCLVDLSIFNQVPQRYKRSDENTPRLSIIEFSRLKNLTLLLSHIDYLEQFLVDINTRLPCLVHLNIPYEHLEIVTEDFTCDATRQNCAQLNYIQFNQSIVLSKKFYLYFPSLK